jgi:site-specific recombinase XerD
VLDTTCFFARSMASANGTSHAPIHQLLGHADPRTTSIYTAAHASDLTAVLRNAGML